MSDRLCIGFFPMGGPEWMGGRNILLYILAGLRALPDSERPEIVLLVTERVDSDLACMADRVLQVDWGSRAPWGRIAGRLRKEPDISRFLRTHRIDAVFCQQSLAEGASSAVLTYIPDFQHFRLPEMFSSEEIASRNKYFRQLTQRAARVILTSQAALEDFREFAPDFAAKGEFLPVVAQVSAVAPGDDPSWICAKYNLPERFFYMPNQFWRHKNHVAVIRALGALRPLCPEITVVCTGHPNDPRHPSFLSELLSEIARTGVHDQIRLLGMAPHEDIQPLMRQSLAVLQPSLFEGWSATVEEARSLGKPLVVSDMPIFREKGLSFAAFFDPNSVEDLACALQKAWNTFTPGPDMDSERQARADVDERTLASGRRFVTIVQEAVNCR